MDNRLVTISLLMIKAINKIVELRNIFRERGDYQIADEIRCNLGELGINLNDTFKGTVWKIKH